MNIRQFRLLYFYLAALVPLVIWGAAQALQTNANSPVDWVAEQFAPRAEYDQFRDVFGSGDVVVISWSGCTIDLEELDVFTDVLRRAPAFYDSRGEWFFESVQSGREVLGEMTSGPNELDREDAISRLRGTLIGPDRLTTCVVAVVTPEGLVNRDRLVQYIQKALRRYCHLEESDWHMAGPVIDGLSVDQASQTALQRFAIPSSVLVFVLCWICLKHLRAAVVVFAISLLGQGLTLALLHYSGRSMHALLIVMPPLLQVLAVAAGIHLTNYIFDVAQQSPGQSSSAIAHEAVRRGWLPCVLSAGTTAIGLASLMMSEMFPIREFGAYASAGVVLTCGLVLALIPAVYSEWPSMLSRYVDRPGTGSLKPVSGAATAVTGHANAGLSTVATGRTGFGWRRITTGMSRWHGPLLAFTVAGMLFLTAGLPRLQTSVRIETLFGSNSRILNDYQWLEDHVAPLVPLEVVLRFDSSSGLSFPERLRLVRQVESQLKTLPDVSGTMSSATALSDSVLMAVGVLDPPSGAVGFDPRGAARRVIVASQLEQALRSVRRGHRTIGTRPGLNHPDGFAEDDLWRITLRVSSLNRMDYQQFLDEVRTVVEPQFRDIVDPDTAGVHAEFTGVMPLVHGIQRRLMDDLFNSFLAALVLITVTMTLVHGSVSAGLVSMIPNVFPIVLLFGGLAWLQIPMDIGMVMTASVALGIAVDDTLHFLTFFRRGLNAGMTRQEAVVSACEHCGRAMFQTSLACGVGLLAFALSDFLPTARFAWMMTALMAAALFGDLVILPALLLSPLGRVFWSPDSIPNAADT